MSVVKFPDRSRLLLSIERQAISQFAAKFSEADLEFTNHGSHEVAMFRVGDREVCVLRQGEEVLIVSLFWKLIAENTEVTVEAKAITIEAALALSEQRVQQTTDKNRFW